MSRPRLRVGDRVKVIYEGEVTRITDADGHERIALWEDDDAAKIHVGERGHVVVTHLMHDRRNRVVPARPWWRFW